ncbi:MAG TPA: PepSY domain-containing protein [Chthoniobacterales bacterium]
MENTYRNKGMVAAVLLASLTSTSLFAAGETAAQLMTQAKISKAQAEHIAMAKLPHARIQSAEIENEHNALVWSFDMVKTGSKTVTEVLVNAKTGKIVDISTETPGDQAKEHAADKANGQK